MATLLHTQQFFLDAGSADVKFIFRKDDGDRTNELISVPAHKIILSAESSVFKTMFYGSLTEKGDIEIVDASVDGFKEFLSWFYLSEKKFTFGNVEEVLYLAEKYNVEKCLRASSEFLEGFINLESFWFTYRLGVKYALQNVIEKCEETIPSSANDLFS